MSGGDDFPRGVRGLDLEDEDRERKVNEMVEFLAKIENVNPRVSEKSILCSCMDGVGGRESWWPWFLISQLDVHFLPVRVLRSQDNMCSFEISERNMSV